MPLSDSKVNCRPIQRDHCDRRRDPERSHQDKNIGWLAEQLNSQGIQLREARVIPDIRETIIETVKTMSAAHDLVFTSGGIGPTHDDITTECIAAAFGKKVIRHPEAGPVAGALREHWSGIQCRATENGGYSRGCCADRQPAERSAALSWKMFMYSPACPRSCRRCSRASRQPSRRRGDDAADPVRDRRGYHCQYHGSVQAAHEGVSIGNIPGSSRGSSALLRWSAGWTSRSRMPPPRRNRRSPRWADAEIMPLGEGG